MKNRTLFTILGIATGIIVLAVFVPTAAQFHNPSEAFHLLSVGAAIAWLSSLIFFEVVRRRLRKGLQEMIDTGELAIQLPPPSVEDALYVLEHSVVPSGQPATAALMAYLITYHELLVGKAQKKLVDGEVVQP